jgi:hypothetical protein
MKNVITQPPRKKMATGTKKGSKAKAQKQMLHWTDGNNIKAEAW